MCKNGWLRDDSPLLVDYRKGGKYAGQAILFHDAEEQWDETWMIWFRNGRFVYQGTDDPVRFDHADGFWKPIGKGPYDDES